MPVRTKKLPFSNLAELLHQLGDIAPERVRSVPPVGTATEKDVLRLEEKTGVLCELIDGVLVEKVMGHPESSFTLRLSMFLGQFLEDHPIGYLTGADGAARLFPGLVRIPDISFFSWKTLGKEEELTDPIAGVAPDLAVEVLSPGNTPAEMKRKRREYFMAGVKLVWLIDKDKRTVVVYSGPETAVTLAEGEMLDGGDVLPRFRLELTRLFAKVPRTPPKPKRGKRKGDA